MHISKIKNIIWVCNISLMESVNYDINWKIDWNPDCGNDILTQNNGRCYFITVNDEIVKIGHSDAKGGIKATINTYKSSGNSGRPSDRTHGIFYLITRELIKNDVVKIYFHYNPIENHTIKLMDDSVVIVQESLSGKILEVNNLKIYKNLAEDYPEWNFQEKGQPWPKYIQDSRNKLLKGHRLTIEEVKESLKKD